MNPRGRIVTVLGTTASGKSTLGIELAERFGGEIISADSRQVYRGLDLGTGKVTPEETRGVPHHLIDILEPGEPFSAAEFQQRAFAVIDRLHSEDRPVFLVGGTGLYLRAVVEGYSFGGPEPDFEYRASLERRSTEELGEMFLKAAGAPQGIDLCNRHRLIRALERQRSGAPTTDTNNNPRYDALQIGVTWPKQELDLRIDERLRMRLAQGMLNEVSALRAGGALDGFLDALGLEYRYCLRYLKGELASEDELFSELGRAIKQFAKRQMTWFRRDRDVLWLDMHEGFLPEAERAVDAFLRS